jgi:hypothetical protein
MELFGKAGKEMREMLKEIAENKGDLDKYVVSDRAAKALGAFGAGAGRAWRQGKTIGAEATGQILDDLKGGWENIGWEVTRLKAQFKELWGGWHVPWSESANYPETMKRATAAGAEVDKQRAEYEYWTSEAEHLRNVIAANKKLLAAYEAVGEEAGKNAEAADKLTEKVKLQTGAILGNADALQEVRKFLADYEKAQAGLPKFYQEKFAPNVEALRGAVLGYDEAKRLKEMMEAHTAAEKAAGEWSDAFEQAQEKVIEQQEADFIKRQDAMAAAAARIWDATRTPLEKYRNALAEIAQLYSLGFFGGGAVGQRTAGRAGLQAQAEYLSASDRLHQGRSNWVGPGLAGSADAYRALYGQLFGRGEKTTQQEALAEARAQTRHLEAIRRMMEVVKQIEPQNFPEADL